MKSLKVEAVYPMAFESFEDPPDPVRPQGPTPSPGQICTPKHPPAVYRVIRSESIRHLATGYLCPAASIISANAPQRNEYDPFELNVTMRVPVVLRFEDGLPKAWSIAHPRRPVLKLDRCGF